jgi:hypothetical protein
MKGLMAVNTLYCLESLLTFDTRGITLTMFPLSLQHATTTSKMLLLRRLASDMHRVERPGNETGSGLRWVGMIRVTVILYNVS